MVVVRAPYQVARCRADVRHLGLDRRTQTVDVLHAVVI